MKTKSIRFYWNGIKVNGERKLIKCLYWIDEESGYVIMRAREYDHLPGDVFDVKNDTDWYTDYFDSDSTVVKLSHPLYKYARYAAARAEIHNIKTRIRWIEKELSGRERWPNYHDSLREELESRRSALSDWEAIPNPGNPTADDLAEIDLMRRLAAEKARLAEEKAEKERREKAEKEREVGREFITNISNLYPMRAGEPVVTINWSEHPAFYDWGDGELKLSMAAAEIILSYYDSEKSRAMGGYYKTSFSIEFSDGEEDHSYEGRYDLGDCEGGLIAHIRNWGEWTRTHDAYGHEIPQPEASNTILHIADMLEKYTAAV